MGGESRRSDLCARRVREGLDQPQKNRQSRRRAVERRGQEWAVSDGELTLRSFRSDDEPLLLAGRDAEWSRWLGPGHDHPRPTACIVVDDEVVGWVDSDPTAERLRDGETNLGYNVFAPHRGCGYATRAVQLMLRRLATEGEHRLAALEIQPLNAASVRVAEKAGFVHTGEGSGGYLYSRCVE